MVLTEYIGSISALDLYMKLFEWPPFLKSWLTHFSTETWGNFDSLAIGDECTYEAILDESKGKAAAKNIVLKNGGNSGGDRGGRQGSLKSWACDKKKRVGFVCIFSMTCPLGMADSNQEDDD